jgi:hypothetical protein
VKPTPKKNYNNTKRGAPFKKSDKEISIKDEIKEMFKSWFKKHNSVGQVMTKQDVIRNILTKVGPKQDNDFEDAMNELVREGLFEVQADGVTLVLTQQGAESVK